MTVVSFSDVDLILDNLIVDLRVILVSRLRLRLTGVAFTGELNFRGVGLVVGSLVALVLGVLLVRGLLVLLLVLLLELLLGLVLLRELGLLVGLVLRVLFLNVRALLLLSHAEFDLFLGLRRGKGSRNPSIFPFDVRRTIDLDFSLYSLLSSFRNSVTPVRRREDTEGDGDTGVKVQIAGRMVFSMPFELSLNNSKDSRKDFRGEVFLEEVER